MDLIGILALAAGFLAFMAVIGSVQAVDRFALGRYGYRPFALPNLAFMLIPHGMLAVWLAGVLAPAADAPLDAALSALPGPIILPWGLAGLGVLMALGLFLILRVRANAWIGLFAVGLMMVGASVLLLSALFADLAQTASGSDAGRDPGSGADHGS
jgi:hypothetical protein